MIEKDDWRLVDQTRYLMHIPLKKAVYRRPSPNWDHDHCEFCWDTFSEYDGDLHEGYCTIDETYWICPECFADFKEMFHWTLAEKE